MRVLLINSVCGRQSTGRIVSDIKKRLIELGHECVIAYGEKNSIADENDYHIGSEMDRYIHAGLSRILDITGFGSRNATEKLIRWIDEYNPDIIHLHNLHGYYINIEVLFKYLKRVKKRVIWTLHDCWTFTGHCAYFDYIDCEKWKYGCSKCPQKNEYPARWLIDNSKKNYKKKRELFTGLEDITLVTPSKWLHDLVKLSFLANYPVVVVNNGIDTTVFKKTESDIICRYGLNDKRVLLGVAAVWDRRKGLEIFLKLSERLDEKYVIVLVGLSKEQIRSLPRRIIGIPATDSVEELVQLYSAAYVYINPTYEDNYPTTNLESIACGTPVITFNTGGSPESASQYGIVVNKGDVEGILTAIDRIGEVENNGLKLDAKTAIGQYIDLYLGSFRHNLGEK